MGAESAEEESSKIHIHPYLGVVVLSSGEVDD